MSDNYWPKGGGIFLMFSYFAAAGAGAGLVVAATTAVLALVCFLVGFGVWIGRREARRD